MKDDHWPEDFTYGFGGPARQPAPKPFPKLEPAPLPVMVGDGTMTLFEAKRWCVEQVIAARAVAPPAYVVALHEEAAALFDFMFPVGTPFVVGP